MDNNNDWIKKANPSTDDSTALELFIRSMSKYGIAGNMLLKAYQCLEHRQFTKSAVWVSFAMIVNNEIFTNLTDYVHYFSHFITLYFFPYEYRVLKGVSYQNYSQQASYSLEIRSDLLVNAVLAYIDKHHTLTLKHADVKFESNPDTIESSEKITLNKTLQYISKFTTKLTPKQNIWIKLPGTSIEFKRFEIESQRNKNNLNPNRNQMQLGRNRHRRDDYYQEDDDYNSSQQESGQRPVLQLEFRNAKSKGGSKSIDEFIQNAVQHNLKIIEEAGGPSRYYMNYKRMLSHQNPPMPTYQAYPLYETKTFDTLFFPAKSDLLRRIDQFLKKEGKYALKGFPYKLGLLLSGPPGTGKTSFIKALAHYTGRSILNINLGKISTNGELYQVLNIMINYIIIITITFIIQIMFTPTFVIEEQMSLQSTNLNYGDFIFVFEDVDAQSSVVIDRKLKQIAKQVYDIDVPKKKKNVTADDENSSQGSAPYFPTPIPQGLASFGGGGRGFGGGRGGRTSSTEKKKEDEEKQELKIKSDDEVSQILSKFNTDNDDTKKKLEMYKKWYSGSKDSKFVDELDLSGLLNVLDGILDTPGRIVIMTSNYPEILDQALLRPGRIDRHEVLSYINVESAIDMLEHYFNKKLDISEKLKLNLIINNEDDVQFTPAELESKCADYCNIEDLFLSLENVIRNIKNEKEQMGKALFDKDSTINSEDSGTPKMIRSYSAPVKSSYNEMRKLDIEESTEALLRMQSSKSILIKTDEK